jgi:hypothetical protein
MFEKHTFRWRPAVAGFALALAASSTLRAVEVTAAADGLKIDAGAAGIFTLPYPTLTSQYDENSWTPTATVNADGSGAVLVYAQGGKIEIKKQADGTWTFHGTEIPPDRFKCPFGISFSTSILNQQATWSAEGQGKFPSGPQPFPIAKGKPVLAQGYASSLTFKTSQGGFSLRFPQKTFGQVVDQRIWGIQGYKFGITYYFPNYPQPDNTPEINFSIQITDAAP